MLDVYAPTTQGDWPVVIIYHGGGQWKGGVKDLAQAVAQRGAVVFAPSWYGLDYDLSVPLARSDEDAACAVRFARAHASKYGGHPGRVIVVGHSYGGTVGAILMLAGDEFHGDCLTHEGSALADAFVGLDGVYDLIPLIAPEVLQAQPAECIRNNPFTYVDRTPRRDNISFRLFVGAEPELRSQAQAFRDALQAAGYKAEIYQIPRMGHDSMVSPWPETVDAIAALLRP
jgi:acetyl esterase/lipase